MASRGKSRDGKSTQQNYQPSFNLERQRHVLGSTKSDNVSFDSCPFHRSIIVATLRLVQSPESVADSTATSPRGILSADWFSPKRFAFLLALLIFATFPQVLLGLQTFVVRDYGFFAYPLAHFQRQAFWHGELPLWNPYNNCGVPFLAQWNTMPLYPPALLYLLPPLKWSLSFFCLAHQWFAGFGAYLLARRWTQNNFAAAFAGVAFAFNGMTLNLLMWPSHIATFAWMPWVVLLVERAWREGGRFIFLAAIAGALQMLAGGPETILFTWLLLSAMWLLEIIRPSLGAQRHRIVISFPLIVLLVAALAAAQLLPFLDFAAHSQRDAGYADSRWAMPLRGWANFFVPMAFGRIWNMGVFFQHGQAWTSSYYLGIAATLLAVIAVWRARERRVWLLALAGFVALLFAFGDNLPPVRWLREMIPQLKLTTYPVKFTLLVAFVAPLLAAFGIAHLLKTETSGAESIPANDTSLRKATIPLGAIFLAIIAAICFWAARAPMPNDNPNATLINGAVRAAFLLASVALLIASARRASLQTGSARRFAPLALLLIAWLDVFTHEPTQNPTVQPEIYEPGFTREGMGLFTPPIPGESRAMVSPEAEIRFTQLTTRNPADNLIVKRLGLFANCNLLDNVPKVNGFFSLYPREIGVLMSAIYSSTNFNAPGLLDFMGVSQLTSPTNFYEWQARTNFLPLITGGQRPVFTDETNALLTVLHPQFDARKFVLLHPEARAFIWTTNNSEVQLLGWRFKRELIECEVEASDTAMLVFAQTYYHCWRAYVDDQPVGLHRANFAFQALEVHAGKHRVRIVYEDRAFKIGRVISLTGLLLCIFGLAAMRRRTNTP